jgi:5-methylthioadenosine/S-adenosylhomocysteine deaminase
VTEVYTADHVLPVGAPPLRQGAVAVQDGLIVAVGSRAEVLSAFPDAQLEELGAAMLLPALINAHTHLEYATYGGFGDGLPFGDWLADHVARRPRLAPGDVEAAAALGALLCLQSGVGTVADASYSGAAVAAASEAGLRAIVHLEAFGGPDADAEGVVAALRERLTAAAGSPTPLVRLGVSPHSPYTVAPAVFAALDAFAQSEGMTVMTHVAESLAELEAVAAGTGTIADALRSLTRIEATGQHPIELLASAGLLHPGVILVHAVQVNDAQIALIATSGAGVVHCPRSNAILGCGAAPLAGLCAAGVPVGLGTDSPASAIDFDLWAEMRAALLTARVREGRPELATLGGARVLGIDGLVGSLAVGKRADLTAVDLTDTPYGVAENAATSAVFAGSPERTLLTVVDGVVRYRKGADTERVAACWAAALPGRTRMIGTDD